MEFLEERYPEPPLLPADPADRAYVRLLIFRDDELTDPYYAFRRGEDGARGARPPCSASSTRRSASSRTSAARSTGMADIALVPWFLRARDMLGVELDGVPVPRGLARAARAAAGHRGRSRDRRRAVKAVVDSGWLAEHLGDDDLVVGDVRGPNAHMRGHIPGSRPLVLGSPPPAADEESARALAQEIALRLRRHGITGRERLVLVDRGDGIGAMPAAQMAELAGHPQVAILLGGIAGWDGELEEGAVELEPPA